ncbi:MAG TPA: isoprenylcysteine carboxylmethyltransferase family protein [Syntrophobacteria bacterium]|nr:isoprenylcysteine carboxylmethyltransferase family protein [Syntrophobacteria bacterium]
MTIHPTTPLGEEKPQRVSLLLKAGARLGLFLILTAAALFSASGRADWGRAWVLLGALFICGALNLAVLVTRSPELLAARLELERGARQWDKVLSALLASLLVAVLVVAGMDERRHWSLPVPGSLHLAAVVLLLAGDLLLLWAMAMNRFFSKTVRIQRERGHRVVSVGPYRCVRHPGYVGWILMSTALPLILGSLWALVPVGLAVTGMVLRTALEDRMLRADLEGYEEYTGRVRYRLLPGIW